MERAGSSRTDKYEVVTTCALWLSGPVPSEMCFCIRIPEPRDASSSVLTSKAEPGLPGPSEAPSAHFSGAVSGTETPTATPQRCPPSHDCSFKCVSLLVALSTSKYLHHEGVGHQSSVTKCPLAQEPCFTGSLGYGGCLGREKAEGSSQEALSYSWSYSWSFSNYHAPGPPNGILPLLFVLRYWAILLGTFGGPGIPRASWEAV